MSQERETMSNVQENRERVNKAVSKLLAKLPEDLETITPEERIRFLTALLPYSLPKAEKPEADTWGSWEK